MTPDTTWVEIDRDITHKITLITFRCRRCRRVATSSNESTPSVCVCQVPK